MPRPRPRIRTALVPTITLHAHALTAETRRVFEHAEGLVAQSGCRRLTTSFVLFSLVELGALEAEGTLPRSLYRAVTQANPDAYHGIKAAYIGWYRGSCRNLGDEGADGPTGMTPYLPAVLERAERIALCCSGHGARITPQHLLAALLSYDPGTGAVQPGAQYVLAMIDRGLTEALLDGLATHFHGAPQSPCTHAGWSEWLGNCQKARTG